jgi:hypothetical protein
MQIVLNLVIHLAIRYYHYQNKNYENNSVSSLSNIMVCKVNNYCRTKYGTGITRIVVPYGIIMFMRDTNWYANIDTVLYGRILNMRTVWRENKPQVNDKKNPYKEKERK